MSTVELRDLIIQVDLATIQVTQAALAIHLALAILQDQAGLLGLQARDLALQVLLMAQITIHQALAHLVLTTIHLVQELVDHVIAQAALFKS